MLSRVSRCGAQRSWTVRCHTNNGVTVNSRRSLARGGCPPVNNDLALTSRDGDCYSSRSVPEIAAQWSQRLAFPIRHRCWSSFISVDKALSSGTADLLPSSVSNSVDIPCNILSSNHTNLRGTHSCLPSSITSSLLPSLLCITAQSSVSLALLARASSSSPNSAVPTRPLHTSALFHCPTTTPPPRVFDRHTKLLQRERTAVRDDVHLYDYLKDEVGYRLVDRIHDITRSFDVALDLGCGRGHIAKHITEGTIRHLHMCDSSPTQLLHATVPPCLGLMVDKMVLDEEQPFPFEESCLDLVLSCLNLHWVNNLPDCLREVQRCLRPEGVLLGAMMGGDTLYQLRSSLLLAETERRGGVSAHLSPFTSVQDLAALLTNAGFELLTIDTEEITVGYPSLFELLWDLQGMAESNAGLGRALHMSRDTLMSAAAIYQEMYGEEEGIPATFQIIYMIGWKPDPDKVVVPAERGSGQVSIKEIGRLDELVRERGWAGKLDFLQEMDDKEKDKDNKK